MRSNVEVAALLGWLRDHNAGVEQKRRVAFWGLDTGYNSAGRTNRDRLPSAHGSGPAVFGRAGLQPARSTRAEVAVPAQGSQL
ncbi:MAG: erythromycin esterase family protein [Actinoplanes sp.]